MTVCPSCGRENPADARFCNACGTALAATPSREVRKIVTVLFADVVGSTALGEATDPEALRSRMRSYFDDLRRIVERHGGTVEKFIGDAVMAVFGIPVSHEDDALRAVRAAAEMRNAIREHGLEARIGVNSGEVVTGSADDTLVTGDAVNVAARLEQAAVPGEALVGIDTLRLVRDAVRVELVPPLELKGKSEPVEAYRLVEVLAGAEPVARHLDSPLVGRERERQRLRHDFEDVVAERTCRLFTLLGPAGIGKSRLVHDLLESAAGEADVLRGRCLHYGEGITYWPLVEILVALGIDSNSIIGSSPEETRLAFRRLLEARASERPQIVVVDDLQWAEPLFLDLVEHIADFSREAPIFLLCIARTELLELRPGWGGGKVNATSLLLEPLDAAQRDVLIENLLAGGELEAATRTRIAETSQGNPLYVEEMLAMVREGGTNDIHVPPTIHALLQARLDTLDSDERLVIERGSVEGEIFHRGSVAVLAPEPVRPTLESHLSTLVRKELIRPDRGTFPDDEAFRFRHLLIRDAAYESLPKATRAELHEQFADWLAQHDLVEKDEILGYHLEQAHRYRAELDPADARLGELAGLGAERLTAAGDGAMDRGDWAAARSLLRRARALLPPGDDRRALLAPQLSVALQEAGEFEEAIALAREAREAKDPIVRARGIVAEAEVTFAQVGDEIRAQRDAAREVLEEAGDDLGLAQYWRAAGWDHWSKVRTAGAKDAWDRGIRYARKARAGWIEAELGHFALSCVLFGPTPVPEAIEHAERVLQSVQGSAMREASAHRALGMLLAMRGEIEEGRGMVERARATWREAGLLSTAAGMGMTEAAIELRAGHLEAQERILRETLEELERIGDRYFLPTVAVELAEALVHRGVREDEIASLSASAREKSLPEDFVNFVYVDGIDAVLHARRGNLGEAAPLARRSLEGAADMDHFDVLGTVRLLAAETLDRCGEHEEAAGLASSALAVFEQKGDLTGTAWARARLQELGLVAT